MQGTELYWIWIVHMRKSTINSRGVWSIIDADEYACELSRSFGQLLISVTTGMRVVGHLVNAAIDIPDWSGLLRTLNPKCLKCCDRNGIFLYGNKNGRKLLDSGFIFESQAPIWVRILNEAHSSPVRHPMGQDNLLLCIEGDLPLTANRLRSAL